MCDHFRSAQERQHEHARQERDRDEHHVGRVAELETDEHEGRKERPGGLHRDLHQQHVPQQAGVVPGPPAGEELLGRDGTKVPRQRLRLGLGRQAPAGVEAERSRGQEQDREDADRRGVVGVALRGVERGARPQQADHRAQLDDAGALGEIARADAVGHERRDPRVPGGALGVVDRPVETDSQVDQPRGHAAVVGPHRQRQEAARLDGRTEHDPPAERAEAADHDRRDELERAADDQRDRADEPGQDLVHAHRDGEGPEVGLAAPDHEAVEQPVDGDEPEVAARGGAGLGVRWRRHAALVAESVRPPAASRSGARADRPGRSGRMDQGDWSSRRSSETGNNGKLVRPVLSISST